MNDAQRNSALFSNQGNCEHSWRSYQHDVPLGVFGLETVSIRSPRAVQCKSCGILHVQNEPQLRLKVLAGLLQKCSRLVGPEIRFVFETIGYSVFSISGVLGVSSDEIEFTVGSNNTLEEVPERLLRVLGYCHLLQQQTELMFFLGAERILQQCKNKLAAFNSGHLVLEFKDGEIYLRSIRPQRAQIRSLELVMKHK